MSSAAAEESGFEFLALGAIIKEFRVAGHDIVQSFPTPEHYTRLNDGYFGETVGRTTNRIKNGVIDNLNGRSYKLVQNNGSNALHGGEQGFGKRLFIGPTAVKRDSKEGVYFFYTSPDGEEGYPGTVEVRVWYTAYEEKEDEINKVILEIEYEVEMTGAECEETAVGITNHSYFNLTGTPTIDGTEAVLSTDRYLPVDETNIPLGNIDHFPGVTVGKPFTFGEVDRKLDDVDHCFIVDDEPSAVPIDTRSRPLKKLVGLSHPITKLHLDVLSTEPAFQFYSGKNVDVPATEDSPAHPPRAGICIEPSRYVNAINVPEWRNMVVLKRGQIWGARSMYRAWKG